jgi:asparagine synthase (glutamine-hydrolysing)
VLSFAVQGTEKKVKTFTVGFVGAGVIDERPFARLAAERFGTEHHEISFTSEDFWQFLPSYVWHMEEPICEPPAVALYHVSKLARNHVKVLLSGEGGDEAFAGYPNYTHRLRLNKIERALGPLARLAGASAETFGHIFGSGRLRHYGNALGRPLPSSYFSRTAGPFTQKGRGFLSGDFMDSTAHESPAEFIRRTLNGADHRGLLNQMLYIDTMTWLPDDLLVKADKMTMANSIELRVPLLDHKVLEFAASLPDHFKAQGSETKRVLKAAFAKTLPGEILTRKKAGFPVPYQRWLSRDFNSRIRDILLSSSSLSTPFFDRRGVESLLDRNAETASDPKMVFSLLIIELWLKEFSNTSLHSKNAGIAYA